MVAVLAAYAVAGMRAPSTKRVDGPGSTGRERHNGPSRKRGELIHADFERDLRSEHPKPW